MDEFAAHFGVENIPFGIASGAAHHEPQAVTRYEDTIIFLADLISHSVELQQLPLHIFHQTTLNSFAALGRSAHQSVRRVVQSLIRERKLPTESTEKVNACRFFLPVSVGDFTDFSCSEYHNLNAGHAAMGRRGLPPAWDYVPPGYSGRCSSIMVSGTPVRRPRGQFWEDNFAAMKGENKTVIHGPCRRMDYELEIGAVVGKPVPYGESVNAKDAREHIFGFVLLNDWSARDIQVMEMIPLGPLNSKNSGTTMSPWIIPYDSLEAFRTSGKIRQNPLAPHLEEPNDRALSIDLEVKVIEASGSVSINCRCNSKIMAWSFEQLVAHQSSAGCGVRAGDLLGIGTVSEEEDGKRGCLFEDNLPDPAPKRGFLSDGDIVQLTGICGKGVGFGDCRAQLIPALDIDTWKSDT
ncbi:hypothetical protein MBLNU459_g2129t1 [Dothideomycetes sp. NU459]